ncbi:MAG: KH domain-containing protein [Clostridiales bacterium]|nr:KH domain-containing protein [Clostridiales bacterium]
MVKEFIGTGKTIDEATLAAKTGLNAPLTADVKIEVVQMPKKKVLGLFGGSDAQVKASYDDGKRERKPQQKKKAASQSKKPAKNNIAAKDNQQTQRPTKAEKQTAVSEKNDRPEKNNKYNKYDKSEKYSDKNNKYDKTEKYSEKHDSDEKSESKFPVITEEDIDLNYACEYLKSMISGLKVEDVNVTAKIEDNVLVMNVECDDYGIIIGRRGETLDALQFLTGLAIKNKSQKYVRVSLNVGDYRAKRQETLIALAQKNANFVLRTRRRYTFEPMNPYERRIIHTAVQEIEGVTSRSVGSGIDRRVVIELEGGSRPYNNNYGYNRGGNRRNSRPPRQNSSYEPQVDPNREKKVDRADLPKFGKIEVNKD